MPEATMNAVAPAQRCLEHIESFWALHGWELPERRYLAAGSPGSIGLDNEDCLYVALSSIQLQTNVGPGTPSKGAGAQQMTSATYVVRLMRYSPNWDSGPPDVDELNATALSTLLDPGRLAATLFDWRLKETAPGSTSATFLLGNITSEGPMGFSAGHSVPFTIAPVM